MPATRIRARIAHTMTLTELLNQYQTANQCSTRYVESLTRSIRKAEHYGIKTICQLDADRLNDFLGSLAVSPTTRHNIRRELLTLWRFAFDRQWTREYPARVRRIAPRYAAPQAWSYTELVAMLRQAEADQTQIHSRSRVRRCDVLPAWISVGYESGLRLGDILALRKEDFRNGCVSVRANKTGKVTVRRLSSNTQGRLDILAEKSPDGTVFRWTLTRRRAIEVWGAFLKENKFRGSSKWLRRSGATALENVTPGMATRWLDHSNPALAKRHYLDATLQNLPDSPPPITT